MVNRKVHTTRTTRTTTEYTIEDIRAALALPPQASIFVRVPGGGDWSNTNLSLEDSPLVVEYTHIEESET